jgi:uncharacterized membrane protein
MTHWLRFAALVSVFVTTLISISAAYAAPAATSGSTATPSYSTAVIGPFGRQYRTNLALNNKGHVTGQTSGAQAFLYDGTLHPLGKPSGARFSTGESISDNDVIAATAQIGSMRNAYVVTYINGRATWTRLPGLSGYLESEAEAILPDGSMIAGNLCATGDPACSHMGQHALAVVWKRTSTGWSAPLVLSAAKGPFVTHASGIARNGAITVVTGSIAPTTVNGTPRAVLWLLPGNRPFQIMGTRAYPFVVAGPIAHASGSTFYVAGSIQIPGGSTYGEPAMWTFTCTAAGCHQTRLQVISPIGESYAVNSHGVVVGYDRTDGGAGSGFIWQNGKETLGGPSGMAINDAGQIVSWRYNPPLSNHAQVILLTPKS